MFLLFENKSFLQIRAFWQQQTLPLMKLQTVNRHEKKSEVKQNRWHNDSSNKQRLVKAKDDLRIFILFFLCKQIIKHIKK